MFSCTLAVPPTSLLPEPSKLTQNHLTNSCSQLFHRDLSTKDSTVQTTQLRRTTQQLVYTFTGGFLHLKKGTIKLHSMFPYQHRICGVSVLRKAVTRYLPRLRGRSLQVKK
ncbi:hypothetical protein CRENBAI_018973 [Crenichthys baileyi]|uniref:Uncharacterized protein n=1 Tax=Crenichthys baileyi TaxID=28760 RepID=A0AAV9RLF5_9TELE